MVYDWQVLPSPRPLWLGADAVCVAPLADECSTPIDCASNAPAIADTMLWVGALSVALAAVALSLLECVRQRDQPRAIAAAAGS